MSHVLSPRARTETPHINTALPSITYYSDGERLCQPSDEQYREYREREVAKLSAHLNQAVSTAAGTVPFDHAAWLEHHKSMSRSESKRITRQARMFREGRRDEGFSNPQRNEVRNKHQAEHAAWIKLLEDPRTGFRQYIDECSYFTKHGTWPSGERPRLPNCTGLAVWRIRWLKILRDPQKRARYNEANRLARKERMANYKAGASVDVLANEGGAK